MHRRDDSMDMDPIPVRKKEITQQLLWGHSLSSSREHAAECAENSLNLCPHEAEMTSESYTTIEAYANVIKKSRGASLSVMTRQTHPQPW